MVTQAISTAVKVTGTIASIVSALNAIDEARKDCRKLEKMGLRVEAAKLDKELDRQAAKLKKSLSRQIAARLKARRKARTQGRSGSGQFS